MKLHKIVILAITFAAATAQAEEFTFPSAGGDLSDMAAWGESAPSASDVGIVDKGGDGVRYSLNSSDLTLLQLKVNTNDKLEFDFRSGGHTIYLSAASFPLDVYNDGKTGKQVSFRGGTWNMGGQEFRGQRRSSWLILYDGAVITNVSNFYNCYNEANNSVLRLQGNAAIYYDASFNFVNRDTTGALLQIYSGAKIVGTGAFNVHRGNGSHTPNSNNEIVISGEGSEIISGASGLGGNASGNRLKILSGGAWRVGGNFSLGYYSSNGPKFSATNSIVVADGAFSGTGTFLVPNARTCDNVFAATNAVITFGNVTNLGTRTTYTFAGSTEMTVGSAFNMNGTGGKVTVAGGKIAAGAAFELHNDNVLRFELPAGGYAADESAITAGGFVFDPTASIEVDYSAYGAADSVTLISLPSVPSASGGVSFKQWVKNQNVSLPHGRRLWVEESGSGCKVMFGPPRGFVLTYR